MRVAERSNAAALKPSTASAPSACLAVAGAIFRSVRPVAVSHTSTPPSAVAASVYRPLTSTRASAAGAPSVRTGASEDAPDRPEPH